MEIKPRILGIIPARAGSKGIPNKNIRLLAGKPLIEYTIQSALLSKYLHTVMVSTDSQGIMHVVRQYPDIETPFSRPTELAQDATPTVEVLQHALNFYSENGRTFDCVCLLQPTSPFRSYDLIDRAIQLFIETKSDSLVTIRKIPAKYNPHWAFEVRDGFLSVSTGDKYIIPRRQELPDAWYRDGKIYLASAGLIRNGRLFGDKLSGFINEDEPDINIDTLEDWILAEKLLENDSSQ